jgi:hypothetical protein
LPSSAIPVKDNVGFQEPQKISYTEFLNYINLGLRNEQIQYMNPAADSSGGSTPYSADSYIWRSNSIFGLEPIFKSTNPETIDSQNQDAFVSGIAFGVAGAAAIAVVQELPEELSIPAWLPRRNRRRKPTPEDAESLS